MLLIACCALLSVDVIWMVVSWALKLCVISTLTATALLVIVVSAARMLQWRTLKHLRHLPRKREVVPFLN